MPVRRGMVRCRLLAGQWCSAPRHLPHQPRTLRREDQALHQDNHPRRQLCQYTKPQVHPGNIQGNQPLTTIIIQLYLFLSVSKLN